MFEVASDADFNSKVFARSNVPPGEGRTAVQVDRLDIGRAYLLAGPRRRRRQLESVLHGAVRSAPQAVAHRARARVAHQQRARGLEAADADRERVRPQQGRRRAPLRIPGGDRPGLRPARLGWRRRRNGGPDDLHPERRPRRQPAALLARAFQRRRGDEPLGPDADVPDAARADAGPRTGSRTGQRRIVRLEQRRPDRALCRRKIPGEAGRRRQSRISGSGTWSSSAIESSKRASAAGWISAWNKKRGTGPHSIDALAWRHNGIDDVVDVGSAYDDTSRPLGLQWGIVAGPPGYDPYPRPSCN